MVAVRVSPLNCERCGQPSDGIVCACGFPRACPSALSGLDGDPFALFGVARSFAQDRPALEKEFYRLSRALHPDRFAQADTEARGRSLEWMSFVNQAYQTLKDPEKLTEYLLKGEGLLATGGGRPTDIPMDLAEAWFELQEKMMDDPAAARADVAAFEAKLAALREQGQAEIVRLRTEYDRQPGRPALAAIARVRDRGNYLESLARDLARVKGR